MEPTLDKTGAVVCESLFEPQAMTGAKGAAVSLSTSIPPPSASVKASVFRAAALVVM
jgi:hypothetical protein